VPEAVTLLALNGTIPPTDTVAVVNEAGKPQPKADTVWPTLAGLGVNVKAPELVVVELTVTVPVPVTVPIVTLTTAEVVPAASAGTTKVTL
jgi:hypothetical protein